LFEEVKMREALSSTIEYLENLPPYPPRGGFLKQMCRFYPGFVVGSGRKAVKCPKRKAMQISFFKIPY
jgi:hypothetical protein